VEQLYEEDKARWMQNEQTAILRTKASELQLAVALAALDFAIVGWTAQPAALCMAKVAAGLSLLTLSLTFWVHMSESMPDLKFKLHRLRRLLPSLKTLACARRVWALSVICTVLAGILALLY